MLPLRCATAPEATMQIRATLTKAGDRQRAIAGALHDVIMWKLC
jgi:hypothetical protein